VFFSLVNFHGYEFFSCRKTQNKMFPSLFLVIIESRKLRTLLLDRESENQEKKNYRMNMINRNFMKRVLQKKYLSWLLSFSSSSLGLYFQEHILLQFNRVFSFKDFVWKSVFLLMALGWKQLKRPEVFDEEKHDYYRKIFLKKQKNTL